MQLATNLKELYDHFLHRDIDRMGYKQLKRLGIFSELSGLTLDNMIRYLSALGIIQEKKQWMYGRKRDARLLIFDREKLYELSQQEINKKRSVSLEELMFKLKEQDVRMLSRKQLYDLIIRTTGLTSSNAVNQKINELLCHDFIRQERNPNVKKRSPHDMNDMYYIFTDRTSIPARLTNNALRDAIKDNLDDIKIFFNQPTHNGYIFTLRRLVRITKLHTTIHNIKEILLNLIESGILVYEDIRIYQKNLYSN